jgi:glycopeptide antibiotics resistance protein
MILSAILAWVNIGNAVFCLRKNRADEIQTHSANRMVLVIKLLLIPFYAINFMIWSLLTAVFIPFAGNIIFLSVAIPIGIGFAYLMLAATSSYSITLLFSLMREGKIPLAQFILHTICQLFFMADVIDQVFILKFTKSGQNPMDNQTEAPENES